MEFFPPSLSHGGRQRDAQSELQDGALALVGFSWVLSNLSDWSQQAEKTMPKG